MRTLLPSICVFAYLAIGGLIYGVVLYCIRDGISRAENGALPADEKRVLLRALAHDEASVFFAVLLGWPLILGMIALGEQE